RRERAICPHRTTAAHLQRLSQEPRATQEPPPPAAGDTSPGRTQASGPRLRALPDNLRLVPGRRGRERPQLLPSSCRPPAIRRVGRITQAPPSRKSKPVKPEP